MSSGTTASSQTWQERVANKQQKSRDAIPAAWHLPAEIIQSFETPFAKHSHQFMGADIPRRSGILTDREIDITENYTVRALLDGLASGSFSSLEVTIAFSKRAAIAQQLTNCLTEIFFEEGQQRAKQLDEMRAKGQLAGPLHGLPISIKDSFKLIGKDSTIGYVAFLDDPAVSNSVLVEILLQLGAVLYVKTNVPQTMMSADSENNIYGRTLNPYNTSLTPGGSSGGEGALVAFRGSPLGVGTDIAGSIRIPAFCCGTYGFRPTSGRIPYGRQASGVKPGMVFIVSTAGPLANDMGALELFTKSVIDTEPAMYDSNVLDVPWRTTTKVDSKSTLRLGMLPEDPRFPLHPPVRRALNEAAEKLKAAGHEIVSLDATKTRVSDSIEVGWLAFGLDPTGVSHIGRAGEPMIQSLININETYKSMKLSYTIGLADLERLDRRAALVVKRQEIAEDWREIWASTGIDAVIAPAAQHTAVPHDHFTFPPYTLLLNVLDYPACVIPFQYVRPELDSEPMAMKPGQIGPDYNPAELAGVPCSIQVFTNRMRDEECLAVSRIVDDCLHQS